MLGTVVGVLRGGPSRDHEASLKSGHALVQAFDPARYTVRDIYIDKKGVWHSRGLQTTPAQALRAVDVALIGLHGAYAEDGQIQKILERLGVPYAGSRPTESFLATHRALAKERASVAGLQTPRFHLFESMDGIDEALAGVIRTFHQPVIVKPVRGSHEESSLVHGFLELKAKIAQLLLEGVGVLVEERIRGRAASAGVIEGMRGETLYSLPITEHLEEGRHLSPGRFSKEETAELYRLTKLMHEHLGMRHYSHSDFVVSPRGIYYLGTRSLPPLADGTALRESMDAVGIPMSDFVDLLVTSTLARK